MIPHFIAQLVNEEFLVSEKSGRVAFMGKAFGGMIAYVKLQLAYLIKENLEPSLSSRHMGVLVIESNC